MVNHSRDRYADHTYKTAGEGIAEHAATDDQQPGHYREQLLFIQQKLQEMEKIHRNDDPLKFDMLNSDPE